MNKLICKNIILLCWMFLVIQCSTSRKTEAAIQAKAVYINQFKLTYLRSLLVKAYNNSPAVREIIAVDHSGITDLILTANDLKLIDSLTTIDNSILVIDSTAGNNRAEGAQGKRPLGFILERMNSRWLDRLSAARFALSGFKI